MDIHSKKGTKIRFTGEHGYKHDINHANTYLKIGEIYTVDYTKVGNWHTDVHLKEIPGEYFNSVHFVHIKETINIMDTKEKSVAYEFIGYVWSNEETNSYRRLNSIMYNTVMIAIEANMKFDKDDFINISKNMRSGYWFGTNLNGKGMGENFYQAAINYNNKSAIKSYESYAGLKPFITLKKHRLYTNFSFRDNKFNYCVTGFDFKKNRVHIVAYLLGDWKKEVKKKLFNFDNKEWLIFRKTINE